MALLAIFGTPRGPGTRLPLWAEQHVHPQPAGNGCLSLLDQRKSDSGLLFMWWIVGAVIGPIAIQTSPGSGTSVSVTTSTKSPSPFFRLGDESQNRQDNIPSSATSFAASTPERSRH